MTRIDEHLVGLLRGNSAEADDYNVLRYALEERRGSDGLRVVAVTSATVGDGKTTTAVNLAGVFAHRRDARVLLVDTDLRRPSVASALRLPTDGAALGLVDAILDPRLTLDQVVTHLPAFNLSVLTAGQPSDEPFELLRAPRAGELFREARRSYDAVVLDTSPLLIVPDSRILENWVDGFVLVVAAHRTPCRLVGEALSLLDPAKVIGVVLNRDDRSSARYGTYGYRLPTPPGKASQRRWS